MKKSIIFIILHVYVLCLAGCSLNQTVDTSVLPDTVTTFPTAQATLPGLSDSTAPHETHSSTTEPPQNETVLPPVIDQPEPDDEDFVLIKTYIPDIFVDLHYSTECNFTNEKIYNFSDAWIRYGTAKKLILVQETLKHNGLSLKIWDAFRPPSAQFKLWDVCPDPTYVSNPNNGFSSHSRGNTVDVTLVYTDGTELVMPTGFDDFSKLADRDYSDCSKEAAANAKLLEDLMKQYGFKPYSGEWWHFSDTQSYPVDEAFEPMEPATYFADCSEYITLRSKPSVASKVITKILTGEHFAVVAKCGEYALIEYNGLWGYVLCTYIQPVE